MMMNKLDVGCGLKPTGDVNIDLYIQKTIHRGNDSAIPTKRISNFIKCDANYLPFRDNAFTESYCSHLLEHKGINATKVVKEMIRVTSRKIIAEVPHRYARTRWIKYEQQPEFHNKLFSVTSLSNFFKKLGLQPKTEIIYRCFPNNFFCLIRLPWAIKIESPVKN